MTAKEWFVKFEMWACSCAQLLDGWHADGTAWTEWDESVRKELLELQTSIPERESGEDV